MSRLGGAQKAGGTMLPCRTLIVPRRGPCGRRESGAVAVEFALILVPFLVLIFGMVQYGMYFYSAQAGSHAANTAIRELSVGKCTHGTELQDFVEEKLGGSYKVGTAAASTSYVNSDGTIPAAPQAENVTVGGQVTLTVAFDSINLNFPLLPFLSEPKITRTVDARVEWLSTPGCGG
jgi:Flp pilus assembly protein TadG